MCDTDFSLHIIVHINSNKLGLVILATLQNPHRAGTGAGRYQEYKCKLSLGTGEGRGGGGGWAQH